MVEGVVEVAVSVPCCCWALQIKEKPGTPVELQAVKLLATYLSNPSSKDVAASTAAHWLEDSGAGEFTGNSSRTLPRYPSAPCLGYCTCVHACVPSCWWFPFLACFPLLPPPPPTLLFRRLKSHGAIDCWHDPCARGQLLWRHEGRARLLRPAAVRAAGH